MNQPVTPLKVEDEDFDEEETKLAYEADLMDLFDDARTARHDVHKITEKSETVLDPFYEDLLMKLYYLLGKYQAYHSRFHYDIKRRKDHWDYYRDAIDSDPMLKQKWDELSILMRLSQNDETKDFYTFLEENR